MEKITQVMNVIEFIKVTEFIDDPNIMVHSFLMPHRDDNQHPLVNEGEQLFARLAKENGMDEDDLEECLDYGFYEKGDYRVIISWSASVK